MNWQDKDPKFFDQSTGRVTTWIMCVALLSWGQVTCPREISLIIEAVLNAFDSFVFVLSVVLFSGSLTYLLRAIMVSWIHDFKCHSACAKTCTMFQSKSFIKLPRLFFVLLFTFLPPFHWTFSFYFVSICHFQCPNG